MGKRFLAALFAVLTLSLLWGCPPAPPPPPPPPPPTLEPVPWTAVDGWAEDEPAFALEAFWHSCRALGSRPGWEGVCAEAADLDPEDGAAVRRFFEERFVPHRVNNADGTDQGTITGYYVPELQGSRTSSDKYAYPLYGVPDDLLIIDLGDLYPDLKSYRLRGRVEGRKVIPYWDRARIEKDRSLLAGTELFWVDDPVDLFFLHIQGSGRIALDTGEQVMVHYADQNGHPFRSIGKILIERGEIPPQGMSMQAIKAWARDFPEKAAALLDENPSYVFFSELPNMESPPGALGVPLTAGRSLAVDRRFIPLGAPVFIATTWPCSEVPLQRLMMAQDTGGAIKGAVRADFFWGTGDLAGEYAGRMKQQGRLWVLLPREDAAGPEPVTARR